MSKPDDVLGRFSEMLNVCGNVDNLKQTLSREEEEGFFQNAQYEGGFQHAQHEGGFQQAQHDEQRQDDDRITSGRRQSHFGVSKEAELSQSEDAEEKKSDGTHPKDGEHHGNDIGSFRVTKTLGLGAFSVVKLGTHVGTGRRVALKIMSKAHLKSLGAEGDVELEIRHLKICEAHPHLAKLYDVIDTGKCTVLAIDFCPGGDMMDMMRKRNLPQKLAQRLFQQVVSGVDFMHQKMIVHRDLKIENLLLDSTGTKVKVVDFGLSKLMVGESELLKTACGSPHYAAPEILSHKPYAGPPVDVWSLGVILYCMLSFYQPFHDDDHKELVKKVQAGKYEMPSFLQWDSTGMSALIEGMMCVDPEKRFTLKDVGGNKWFKKKLPPYLTRTAEETEREERRTIDPGVVDEVVRLYEERNADVVSSGEVSLMIYSREGKVTREMVESAAAGGAAEEEVEDETARDLRMAYRLVHDDQNRSFADKKKAQPSGQKKVKKKLTNLRLRGRFM